MPVEIGDKTEAALRARFQQMVSDVAPRGDLFEVINKRRSTRRLARVAGVFTVIVAIAVCVSLVVGSEGSPQHEVAKETSPRPLASLPVGALVKLDSVDLQLPAGFKIVKGASRYCDLGDVAISWPAPTDLPQHSISEEAPQYPAIQTAATSDGGCVSMLITPPGSIGPNGLPGLLQPSTSTQVRAGPYTGFVGTPEQTLGTPPAGSSELVLELQVPASDGLTQELVMIAVGLTQDQLVSVVSGGLQ